MPKKAKLTVIDFFCGAGGFSEGFRQQGFQIIRGIDNWKPAIDTFNHNFNLECAPQDILEFASSIEAINAIPDSDIILGSPPCVSFSTSNKCGNADKALGIKLIEIFLRIVAIKKHQPNSRLKAWFMENVENSGKYKKPLYSFADLGLSQWAKENGKNPHDAAIDFASSQTIINSADYDVAQIRKRLFAGEVIGKKFLPQLLENIEPSPPKSLRQVFRGFPAPFSKQLTVIDPNYPHLILECGDLTDYSYDAGVYETFWHNSKYLKVNHPYMGKMSFPENFDKPSRTVTSTKITSSREALFYKNKSKRIGNGEYRTPTIREIATLMSFPISYQFTGSENTKWKLIGNAVCPMVSGAIAREALKTLNRKAPKKPIIQMNPNLCGINNLNSSKRNAFDKPPKRNKNARFRRHPFKEGNMTVTLSNYNLEKNASADGKWRATVTYGQGEGFKLQEIKGGRKMQEEMLAFIQSNFSDGNDFLETVHNGFTEKIADSSQLQTLYEANISTQNNKLHPIDLIEQTATMIAQYANGETIDSQGFFRYKKTVYKRQLYALYVLNHIRLMVHNTKEGD